MMPLSFLQNPQVLGRKARFSKLTVDNGQLTMVDAAYGRADFLTDMSAAATMTAL